MSVITRFAPSPTGYLHIGSARTALFNYLFAKANNGKFLLRIEDTDKERSTDAAVEAIFDGLKWLGIAWDEQAVFQSKNAARHKDAALSLVEQGRAYYCFTSQVDIDHQRQLAVQNNAHFIFNSPWRDMDPSLYPKDIKPVVRLKAPRVGDTIINDVVQGKVVVRNDHIDDMVLLRSDGTPTYMLAVVVDDHDMNITHIIRGDDHLTNAARQILIYQAFGWQVPVLAHIPMICGPDGAKLSKRHGALGVGAYRDMSFLPEALRNYLLRLGWSYGNEEIIDAVRAAQIFDLKGLGRSPSKLDLIKMKSLNAYYLRKMDNQLLSTKVIDHLRINYKINAKEELYITQSVESLKLRAESIEELANLAANLFLKDFTEDFTSEEQSIIRAIDKNLITQLIDNLLVIEAFNKDNIEIVFKNIANSNEIKLAELIAPVRFLVTRTKVSPSIYEIIAIIGKEETILRLNTINK